MDAYKNPSAFLSACKNYEGSGDRKSSSVFSETKMILSANIIEDTVIMEEIYLVMNEIVTQSGVVRKSCVLCHLL